MHSDDYYYFNVRLIIFLEAKSEDEKKLVNELYQRSLSTRHSYPAELLKKSEAIINRDAEDKNLDNNKHTRSNVQGFCHRVFLLKNCFQLTNLDKSHLKNTVRNTITK